MAGFNLNATPGNLAATLIFRALGMAFLTVPLTALAVSGLEAKDIPQGSALNNMMRQLGGSFGIAMINTYVAHRFGSHRNDLIADISIYNPQATQRIHGLTQYFSAKGGTLAEAQHKAMAWSIMASTNNRS
jgi:DHA2 family multidrug resistance protein